MLELGPVESVWSGKKDDLASWSICGQVYTDLNVLLVLRFWNGGFLKNPCPGAAG